MKTLTGMVLGLWACAVLAGAGYGAENQADEDGSFVIPHFTFAGGTPGDLAAAIAKSSGRKINVVTPDNMKDMKFPKMDMHDVSVRVVFSAANRLALSSDSPMGQWDKIENVWVLQGRPDNRQSQVFYVGYLLEKYKVEDIITSVQAAWQIGGRQPRTEVKYHEDTGLLIVLASKSQLDQVKEVLIELQKGLVTRGVAESKAETGKSARP